MKFIVKLFPEITIKSKSVRKRMVRLLRNNLKTLCTHQGLSVDVLDMWDAISIVLNNADDAAQKTVADILSNTPGIAHSFQVDEYAFTSLDDAYAHLHRAYIERIAGKRFCVRIKRVGKHDFTSQEAEMLFGGKLLEDSQATHSSVSLKQPDVVVRAEIKQDRIHIITRRIEGLGGYPLGTQGDVLSLISGGYDSGVSSYMMMRRGLKTHYCFFNLGGKAHEIGVKQVAHYLWSRYGASHRTKFITVPFEAVVEDIVKHVNNGHMGVVLKRMMIRTANLVAERMNVPALVTGEAIAQVSSQTLSNLNVIDQVSERAILRPLIAMDKQDIIKQARHIGTESFAANMPEYCGVISVNPLTDGNASKTAQAEKVLDDSLIELALKRAIIQRMDTLLDDEVCELNDLTLVTTPLVDDVIVDIRHPNEQDDDPLSLPSNRVMRIPFYELNGYFERTPPSARHLLYCQQGSMSRLHAHQLNHTYPNAFGVFTHT